MNRNESTYLKIKKSDEDNMNVVRATNTNKLIFCSKL